MPKEGGERHQPTNNEHRVARARNRIPRSCLACRTRKLKCNREKPCQNCIVRGKEASSSCAYVGAGNSKTALSSPPKSGGVDVKGRIDRLENLVRAMISGDSNSNSPFPLESSNSGNLADGLPSRAEPLPPTSGTDSGSPISQTEALLLGNPSEQKVSSSNDSRSTHWDVILNDICAIKNAWSEKDDLEVVADEFSDLINSGYRPSLLTGLSPPPDRETLLAALPSRQAADKLLARFFDTYNPAVPAKCALHIPTFYKQYQRHWEDPSKSAIIWIGLLFGVMTIAMHSYRGPNQEAVEYEGISATLFNLYRLRTAQCLEVANVTRPTEFMVETLLLYSMSEYVDQRDGEMGVWILSGLMMRLALQQGLHRDPSTYPNITPFQIEMRRRLWVLVSNHELLFSVQIGVPRTIRYAECDVEPPRNLHESELDEEMTEIPPSRPVTEPTDISYQIAKNRIMVAYGMVIEHLQNLSIHPYNEVMRLDSNLIESRDMIPAHLQWAPIASMVGLREYQIMERSILQLFWNKARCVLHRKYLTSPDTKYSYSRRVCVSSALFLLKQQAALHSESHPGGLLPRIRWWGYSLQNHDYLLAAMIICLALYHEKRQDGLFPSLSIGGDRYQQRAEMLEVLIRAKNIWAEIASLCRDAKKAISILSVVMDKLGMVPEDGLTPADVTQDHSTNNTHGKEGMKTFGFNSGGFAIPAEQEASTISWSTNSELRSSMEVVTPSYQHVDLITDNLFSSNGMFSTWEPNLDLPANLDWSAWDLYVNRSNQIPPVTTQWSDAPFEIAVDGVYEPEVGWSMS